MSAQLDSRASWARLALCVALGTLGGAGLWSVVVVLPAVQADFGVDRAAASFAYTCTMLGFAAGGVLMGRFSDRFGVLRPVVVGTVLLASGYILAGFSGALWQFTAVQALVIGIGSSATFAPLVANVSLWFRRR